MLECTMHKGQYILRDWSRQLFQFFAAYGSKSSGGQRHHLLLKNFASCKITSGGMDGASMMAKLSDEIDAAVREVGWVKAALMGSHGDADPQGYLGLTCAKDRAPLLQLLQLSMQQLDRLREKEIELIRSATATATVTATAAVRHAKQPYSPGEKEQQRDLFDETHSVSPTGGRRGCLHVITSTPCWGVRLSCTQRAFLPAPERGPSLRKRYLSSLLRSLSRFCSTVAVRFLTLYVLRIIGRHM